MAKKTIGSAFGELRAKTDRTMMDVGTRAGLTESAISKIERNKPVRWETVHLALSLGLNVQPGSDAYATCHLLWLKSRAERAEAQPERFASKNQTKHAVEAVRKFRILIRDLTPEETKKALAAATRSARSL